VVNGEKEWGGTGRPEGLPNSVGWGKKVTIKKTASWRQGRGSALRGKGRGQARKTRKRGGGSLRQDLLPEVRKCKKPLTKKGGDVGHRDHETTNLKEKGDRPVEGKEGKPKGLYVTTPTKL